MKVVLATLNAKYIHTSLALRYLKAYSGREFDVEIAEYTIKDPAMNVVSDLFQRRPDVIGFSCYIWNIEETIPILDMIKRSCLRQRLCWAVRKCRMTPVNGWTGCRKWILL